MTRLAAPLTEGILRREVFHRIADNFPTTWAAAQTAMVELHTPEGTGTGSLRVRWRGKGVLRFFEIEKLDESLDTFSGSVIQDVVDSLRRQFEPAEVGAADWGGP